MFSHFINAVFIVEMNLNVRELTQHVEYEPDSYYAAFSAELEICASPMFSLLAHLTDEVNDDIKCFNIHFLLCILLL